MPLDQYSPCPCGSGKKLKFCKCVEQPQDYEKLIRLIEGGQELAAMDRINQMLAKAPNAAWLLALKGELALGMEEVETFKETANRFLKLKPDNPLALIMKSVASTLAGEPVENAAQYLLGGLAESRETLPSMTPFAIDLLIRSLDRTDKLALVGYWGDVQQMLLGNQQPQGESVLQDESLNLIAKVPSRLIEDPPGSAWKERLAEVISLFRIFCFSQAETKLRAILRDFPEQPGPLSYLLRAQLAQLNQSGACATARKLADHRELSAVDRAYFLALAFELESDLKSLTADSILRYCEVDSIERIVEALAPLASVQEAVGDVGDNVRQAYASVVGDEVPARHVYTVFDKDLPRSSVEELRQALITPESSESRLISSAVATVVLYGKQTDKPARALFVATRFPSYQTVNEQILNLLQLGADVGTVQPGLKSDLVEFVRRPKIVVEHRAMPSIEEFGAGFIDDFLNLPLEIFGNATPLQVAGEERYRADLLGLLSYIEGVQSLILPQQTLADLYQQLGLERPAPQVDLKSSKLFIANILDLDRIDLNALSDEHLQGVMLRSLNLAASRVVYHAAQLVLSRETLADNSSLHILARSALRLMCVNFDHKLEHTRALLDLLTEVKAPVGKIVLELVSMLAAVGRDAEAQETMRAAFASNPDDPYLLSFMQHVLQSQRASGLGAAPGLGGEELAHRMSQHAGRSEASSSLLLPGQQSAAPGGESKLWLPGS
jgi:hypothetical protein